MNRIVQATLLFLACALFGFGASVLIGRGGDLASMLAAAGGELQTSMGTLSSIERPPERAPETVLEAAPELASELAPQSAPEIAPEAVNEEAAGPLTAIEAVNEAVNETAVEPARLAAVEAQAAPLALTAVGLIELNTERQVVLATGGEVDEIVVEVGDAVQAGDLLLSLDTTYLDWAVEQAEIGLETARIDFQELGESIDESDIAAAEAALLLAQENLAVVKAGPTQEELAAAESAAAAAWASYAELQEQPTQAQINQALATLRKAEITVEQAQREYDKIAWLPEAAASAAADNLQRATVDLEAARAAFEEVNKPATEAQLQGALSSAQNAQDNLNKLKLKPTPAELAAAEAAVATAQAALDELMKGPNESALRQAELAVRNAMIGLEGARLEQAAARVTAPIDGTVLAVNLDLGQQASAGTVAATLADTSDVKLVVNVEQKDISRVVPGQQVVISIYALPEETFTGVVDKIAPIADSGTGFVTFPVIIQITDGPMERVLPGMTASALFVVDGSGSPTMDDSSETTEGEPAPAATEEPTTEEPATEPTAEPTAEPTEEAPSDTEEGASGDTSTEDESEEPDAEATPAASGG